MKKLSNPLASPSAGAPALKYGDVNTETTSPGEVKGLIVPQCIKKMNFLEKGHKKIDFCIFDLKKFMIIVPI